MIDKSAREQVPAAPRVSRRHAWIAGIILMIAAIVARSFDFTIADAFFYDRSAQAWIGANTWWAVDLIHTGGGWLIRLVGLAALLIAAFGSRFPRLKPLQRSAAYVALALVLCTSVVSGLKQISNVDCPRDLAYFSGDRPYVELLADRPDELPRALCYPGSHSSSGLALMAFYFVFLDLRPRLARGLLAAAVFLGAIFSIGQQARGAHFLSHDLASAAIVWFLLLVLDRWLLEFDAPDRAQLTIPNAPAQSLEGVPPGGPDIGRRQTTDPAIARRRSAGIRHFLQRVFCARVPVRVAATEWRRRSGPGSRTVRPDQGDAETSGLPR